MVRSRSAQLNDYRELVEYGLPVGEIPGFAEHLGSASELDQRFTAVLQDSTAQVYQPGVRYIVYSPQEDRLAILEPDGRRVSVYRPLPNELETLGEKTWLILDLLA